MPVTLIQGPLTFPQSAEQAHIPSFADVASRRPGQIYDPAIEHARNILLNPALYRAAGQVAVEALEASQIIFRDDEGDYILNRGELKIQLEHPAKAAKNLARNAVKPAAKQVAGHIIRKLANDSEMRKSGQKY